MYNYYYLSHHGISGQKWGVKNGPPYPLSESRSSRIGRKRAEKRIKYIEKNTKKGIASASLSKQISSLRMEDLRRQANDILKDDSRLEVFGKQTIINRATALSAGHIAAGGLAFIATAASAPVALVAGSALVPVGASWIYYHYTTR